MIDHLYIRSFLAFPELDVPELKLINLVAGKNNAGKTVLLEALRIYKSQNKVEAVRIIANERGYGNKSYSCNSLFYRKNNEEPFSPTFKINNLEMSIALYDKAPLFYVDDDEINAYGNPENIYYHQFEYVKASVDDHKWIAQRWNSFVLTEKEELVVGILRNALELEVTRVAVTDDSVMVKLGDSNRPVNIRTMGDGMMRIFQIAMALVESKPQFSNLSGLLLIDEIETHLHHSVIRKLWKIIFEYAIKWNIQVVATTHSQDAIRELFYEAAANEEYQGISQVLRLQIGRSGKHEVIQYPYEELKFMMSTNLEIRGN